MTAPFLSTLLGFIECLAEMENDRSESTSIADSEKGAIGTPDSAGTESPVNGEQSENTSLFEILSNKYVNLLAFFILVYVGVEVR